MYSTIQFTKEDDIAYIRLNRPHVLNAMDILMRTELKEVINKIEFDDEINVVVITGNGKGFCAGGDISTMRDNSANAARKRLYFVHPLFKSIINSNKIYIAAVNGVAAGNGYSLACACDFRFAATSAKFVPSFMKIGLVPDCALLYTLPRIIGLNKTKELLLLNKILFAAQAMELGLVNQLADNQNQLLQITREFASEIRRNSPIAIGLTKRILNESFETSLDALCDKESCSQDICFNTEFHQQAIRKFLAKR